MSDITLGRLIYLLRDLADRCSRLPEFERDDVNDWLFNKSVDWWYSSEKPTSRLLEVSSLCERHELDHPAKRLRNIHIWMVRKVAEARAISMTIYVVSADSDEMEPDDSDYCYAGFYDMADLGDPVLTDSHKRSLGALPEATGYYDIDDDALKECYETVYELALQLRAEVESLLESIGGQVGTSDNEKATANNGGRQGKRSTESVGAREKLIAALTLHHEYNCNDEDLNFKPVGARELAGVANVSEGSASTFLKKNFGSHADYVNACRDKGRLVKALKTLNGDLTPRILYKPLSDDSDKWMTDRADE